MDKKNAVVLFQLGGPDSPETVQPFLYNLFMDPDIIGLPFASIIRQPLAKYISGKREEKVKDNYRQIGGKSPILELTLLQARALEEKLNNEGIDASVFTAMRYWHPSTEEAICKIKEERFGRIILLPLYPHYSKATTLSSFKEWNRQAEKFGLNISTMQVCCYPDHPLMIEAIVDNINKCLARFSGIALEDIDLIFSAHGLPVSYIREGDPYQLHIEETVRAVLEAGKWESLHTLCYQSRVGFIKWLKPSLLETIEMLAGAGRKNLLVIPISFVTDHIETLHEIDIDARSHALKLGIRQFEMMPAMNDNPKFIECLAELVRSTISSAAHEVPCLKIWNRDKGRIEPVICPRRADKK